MNSAFQVCAIRLLTIWAFLLTLCARILNKWSEMMMVVKFLFVFLFSFTGLYTYHVFPAVLERQEAFIFWNPIKPDPWQQGSWPTLGTRHLLSQWQEIICAWGHGEKSNDKAASWWNCPLWTTVNTFLFPCFMSLVCFLVLKMGRRERSKEESGLHA